MRTVEFLVNGEPVRIEVNPDEMLADTLRNRLGLLGTKIACREGECGACTVWMDDQPVNSCLVPCLKVDGRSITTIEGLGTTENPHPVQERMAEFGAAQCGFCTPGFVMTSARLLMDNPDPDREDIIEHLSGNLCRCTGYTKIIQAIQSLSSSGKE